MAHCGYHAHQYQRDADACQIERLLTENKELHLELALIKTNRADAAENERLRAALRGLRDVYWAVTDHLGLTEHITGQIANAIRNADDALAHEQSPTKEG